MTKPEPEPMPEFEDAICGECLDIIVNVDPNNMGWTEKQYEEWLDKFDRYCDRYGEIESEDEDEFFDVFPVYSEDGVLDPHFTHSGCPICADGLGNDVYRVTVIKERF